jgi:hypothetical protein
MTDVTIGKVDVPSGELRAPGFNEIHGRDLQLDLGGGVVVYGYACPTHGLRYYREGEDGPLVCAGIADIPQGDTAAPLCPHCLSPLAAALPEGDVLGEVLVNSWVMSDLLRIAGTLRGEV